MDFRMLQNRNFMLSTATMFLLGFVLYASTMLLPVFLQTLLGYTAMRSGLVLSPGGLVIAVSMPVVGFLLSKVEARWLVIFGLCVSAFGLFHMAQFRPGRGLPHGHDGARDAERRVWDSCSCPSTPWRLPRCRGRKWAAPRA